MKLDNMDIVMVIIIGVLLCWIFKNGFGEGFNATRERAEKITGWFNKQSKPKFSKFREEVNGGTNVEYHDAKKLHSSGKLTVDNLANAL